MSDENGHDGERVTEEIRSRRCQTDGAGPRLARSCRSTGGIAKIRRRYSGPPDAEVPYLRVANVQRGYLDLERDHDMPSEAEELTNCGSSKETYFSRKAGDRDKLGRGWVWNGEIEDCYSSEPHLPCTASQRCRAQVRLVPRQFFGQQWFTRTGKQTTNLASINKGVLSRFLSRWPH